MKKIAGQINSCTSESEARAIVEKAQQVIDDSNISIASQKQFWIDLYEELGSDLTYTCESQDSSALSAIIDAAKAAIAQKTSK